MTETFQEIFEGKINALFLGVLKDLGTISDEYLQLSHIHSVKRSIRCPKYIFNYEKGVSLSLDGHYVFEKNGCRIVIEIVYPETMAEPGLVPLEPPTISATINGKHLAGMVFVMAEETTCGDQFVKKVKEIITARLHDLEADLNIKIRYSW